MKHFPVVLLTGARQVNKSTLAQQLLETTKNDEKAINALESMSDDVVMDDIMYRLYVLDKVNRGRKDLKNGSTYVAEDIKKDIENW